MPTAGEGANAFHQTTAEVPSNLDLVGTLAEDHSAAERPGDVRDSLASLDRAQRLLGYHPGVSFEEGLRRTWAWFAAGASATSTKFERLRARQLAASYTWSGMRQG